MPHKQRSNLTNDESTICSSLLQASAAVYTVTCVAGTWNFFRSTARHSKLLCPIWLTGNLSRTIIYHSTWSRLCTIGSCWGIPAHNLSSSRLHS